MTTPRARASLRGFCEEYLAHHFHRPWCVFHETFANDLDDPSVDRIAYEGPREFGKTTLGSLAYTIREALLDPGVRFMLFAQLDLDLAALDLESVRWELERNERLRQDFGDLRGERWERHAIDIRKHTGGVCWVMCVSPQKGIMGAKLGEDRPNRIVLMDPQRQRSTSMRDPRQIAKFEDWLEGDLLGTIAENGKVVLCANPLDHRSYIHKLCGALPLTGPDGEPYGRRDEAEAEKGARWTRRRFQCEIMGHPRVEDGTPLWPAQWPRERIQARKSEVKSSVWSAHHQCDPQDPSGAIFAPAILTVDRAYGRAPVNGQEARSRWEGLRIAGAIDPAFSRSEAADSTAVAVVGRTREGWFPVLTAKRYENRGLAQRAELVSGLFATWGWDVFGVEVVQAQVDFYDYLMDECRRRREYFPVEKITQRSDVAKLARISDLEPMLRNHHLRLAVDQSELRTTLEDFRESSPHDDVPDVLEMAVRLVYKANPPAGGIRGKKMTAPKQTGDWYRRSPKTW